MRTIAEIHRLRDAVGDRRYAATKGDAILK